MKRREFLTGVVGSALGTSLAGCRLDALIGDRREAVPGRLQALRVDHDLCLGCRACEEVCERVNVVSGRTSRRLLTVYPFPGPYYVVWACLGCPDVPCVRACDYYADPLTHRRALHLDPGTGAIALDRDACAGCERCLEACAREGGGVLRWDEREYVAGACHLCDGAPACAPVCPVSAISLIEVDRRGELEPRSPQETASEGIARVFGRELDPAQLRLGEAPLRALRVDHDRCTGCRLCETACDEERRAQELEGERLAGPGDVSRSLIRVHPFEGPFYVAWACLGCPSLPCVAACQAEAFGVGQRAALHLDPETGAIALAGEFCSGCRRCIDACADEGGAVLRWHPEELVVGACTHCGGDPACARACPEGAIELVTVDRTAPLGARRPAEVARAWRERLDGGARS